jgi:hypothetical protein
MIKKKEQVAPDVEKKKKRRRKRCVLTSMTSHIVDKKNEPEDLGDD